MSLGLWRDSSLDLAAMVEAKEEERSEHPDESELAVEEGATAEISVGFSEDSCEDAAATEAEMPSTEPSLQVDESDHFSPPSETSSGLPTTPDSSEGKALSLQLPQGQYSAFNSDFSAYDSYDTEYPYAPTVLGKNESSGNIFCCLVAPWFQKKEQDKIEESYYEDAEASTGPRLLDRNNSSGDDASSTGSEVYGQKLPEQERLAVMARLQVSELGPGPADGAANHGLHIENPTALHQAGLELERNLVEGENGGSRVDSPNKRITSSPRSILKHCATQSTSDKGTATPRTSFDDSTARRRHLFATTYEKKSSPAKNARFAPMARVMTIRSCNDMTYVEKSSVWWQKSDYDSFKKAGRLIAKAIIEGGSEIWLANSSKSLFQTSNKAVPIQRAASDNAKRSYHLSERDELRQEGGDDASAETYGDKWWCRFGHSRRGLEHIASMEEGKERQNNVRMAVRAVLDEQRRQKLYGNQDPEKLRSVSLKHTHWARDLALAAGAADSESVRWNFSAAAKSREFYLIKQASATNGATRRVPSFMNPSSPSPRNLDANTSSQIRFRRLKVKMSPQVHPVGGEEKKAEELEAIHDNTPTHSCISRQAAGYGTEHQDMAAVLSGMGAISTDLEVHDSRTSVGAH